MSTPSATLQTALLTILILTVASEGLLSQPGRFRPVPLSGDWRDPQTLDATFYNPGPGTLLLELRQGEILWNGFYQDQWLVLLDDEVILSIPEGRKETVALTFVCGDPRLRHPASRSSAKLQLARFSDWAESARKILKIETAWQSLTSRGALLTASGSSRLGLAVLQWAVWAESGATPRQLLEVLQLQLEDRAEAEAALATIGTDITSVLEAYGYPDTAAWTAEVTALTGTAGPLDPDRLDGILVALKAPPPAIEITQILGLRKSALGDFRAEPDPDTGGRIFVDTTNAGNINGSRDRQRVKITATITPNTLNPAQLKVRWELRDPDDPAAHPDVDANARGGDNTGTDHEGVATWFTQADHPIAGSRNRAAVDENTVIGEALTDVSLTNGQLISTVTLNYSDDGGDNFKLRAVLVQAGQDQANDDAGTLTVWRKRSLQYWVMRKPAAQGGTYDIFGRNGRTTLAQGFGNSDADLNCYIDLTIADGGPSSSQPIRIGSGNETFRVFQNTRFEIALNGAARVRVTLNPAGARATAAEVRAAINGAAAGNPSRLLDANKKVIVEATTSILLNSLVLPDPTLHVFRWDEEPQTVSSNQMALLNSSYLPEALVRRNTAFHSSDAHAHRRYIIQLVVDEGSPNLAAFGQTEAPHSVVRFLMHKTATGRISTAIHECGHSFTGQAAGTYHTDHSQGKKCAANDGKESQVVVFCPKHAKNFRLRTNRGWSVANAKEAG